MSAAHNQIGSWLGIPPPFTGTDLLQLVEGRLAISAINRLLDLGFSRQEIDATVIALRTLQHRRSRGEKLTVEESDRVLRVLRVLAMTETIYESRERALQWLRRENPRLEGRAPLSLLTTDTGSRLVEQLLGQIDEGYFI
jgi:putative toxin-antitoxin system antitoxin component (TIGR02293 family)